MIFSGFKLPVVNSWRCCVSSGSISHIFPSICLKSFSLYFPHRQVNPELIKNSWDADVAFLRLRMLLLRGLGAAAELCSSELALPTSEENSNIYSGDHNHVGEPTLNGKTSFQHPLLSLEKIIAELENTCKSIKAEGLKVDTSVS